MAPQWAADGFAPTSPLPTLGSGLSFVIPDAAVGVVQGFTYSNSGTLTKTATNNGNSLPRLDLLVLRLDMTAKTITAAILQGTPAASPVLPAVTQNSTTWEIPLAYATCPGSASAQNYSGFTRIHLYAGDRAGTILRRAARSDTAGVASNATDVGVLRLDNVPIVAGRLYRIVYVAHPGGPASAVSRTQLRTSMSGAATIASAALAASRAVQQVGSGAICLSTPYPAAVTGTLSVILCHARDSGTGTPELFADGNRVTSLWVEDAGVDPGDTGVDL